MFMAHHTRKPLELWQRFVQGPWGTRRQGLILPQGGGGRKVSQRRRHGAGPWRVSWCLSRTGVKGQLDKSQEGKDLREGDWGRGELGEQ